MSDIALNINLVSFFAERSFIQNKTNRIISKKKGCNGTKIQYNFKIPDQKIAEGTYQTL